MDSWVSLKDEICFLRVCHHISTGLYDTVTSIQLTQGNQMAEFRGRGKYHFGFYETGVFLSKWSAVERS